MDNIPDMDDLLDQLEANENKDPCFHQPMRNEAVSKRLSNGDAEVSSGLRDLQITATEPKECKGAAIDDFLAPSADQIHHFSETRTNGISGVAWNGHRQSSVEEDDTENLLLPASENTGQDSSSPPEEDASTDPSDLPEADQDPTVHSDVSSNALASAEEVISDPHQAIFFDTNETPLDDVVPSEAVHSEIDNTVAIFSTAPDDGPSSQLEAAEMEHKPASFEDSFGLAKEDDRDSVSSGEMERYLADVQLDDLVDAPAAAVEHNYAASFDDIGVVADLAAQSDVSQTVEDVQLEPDESTAADDSVHVPTQAVASNFFDATQLAGELEAVIERPRESTKRKTKMVADSSVSLEQSADVPVATETEIACSSERDEMKETDALIEIDSLPVVENDQDDDGDYATLILPETDDVPVDEDEAAAQASNDANGEQEMNEEQVVEEGEVPTTVDEGAVVEQQSVIASTHDISASPVRRLTESEMTLGKIKPYWIPDPDSPACLICLNKFTLIRRRHHCRSCGRVLCSKCCGKTSALQYMEDPTKEYKVCDPCFSTLQQIAAIEKEAAASREAQQQQETDS